MYINTWNGLPNLHYLGLHKIVVFLSTISVFITPFPLQLSAMHQKFLVIGCCILCGTFGYALGRIGSIQLEAATFQTTIQTTEPTLVPVVTIDGIMNGALEGSLTGNVRLFIGKEQVLGNGGTFSIASPALLKNIISVQIPDGMQFVASRKGTKYYPVSSAQGGGLSPKNRLYFRTAEEAERAGYRK
jgi:hypothetical protein